MSLTDEHLAALIRRAELAALPAPHLGHLRRRRRRRRADRLKWRLWARVLPLVRALAVRFRHYARRAGLEVADLMQEAWLKLGPLVLRYDPARGTPFAAWLSLGLKHHFIQLGRKRREEPWPEVAGLAAAPEEETARWVREVLDGLLPGDRRRLHKLDAFRRYWLENYTLEEAARAARPAVAISTVSRWVVQVRAAFRAALTQP